jgi:hypothetical protein
MSAETLNEETLAMAAGALLSLAFSYVPGLQDLILAVLANQATCSISPTHRSARALRNTA